MIIWQRTAGPYGFTSMARMPFAERVLRVRDAKMTTRRSARLLHGAPDAARMSRM